MQKLSRSKLELFIECPRCFWLDVNKGTKRPPSFPYTINSSIDALLKQEFDACRAKGTPHELMKKFAVDAIPYQCKEIDQWRHNFTGVQSHHKPTGLLVFGAVDDVWVNPTKELIVVDYKSTGANEYHIYDSYRRQMEIYQWLLKQNGYALSDRGYFLFAKVNKGNGFEGGRLSFDLTIEPLEGDSSWVEAALLRAKETLQGSIPESAEDCKFCLFVSNARE